MKKSPKKIIILWTIRGLIKNKGIKNIIDPKSKVTDSYILYSQGLIKKKIVDLAELVWIDPTQKKKSFSVNSKIKILVFKNLKQAINILKGKEYDYLFVRGNYQEFKKLTTVLSAAYKIFYAADAEYWPNFWPKNYFDLIFVDEKQQLTTGKKIYQSAKLALLDKPVDTKIFRPQKLKKIYDICYLSNFIFWKNHSLLFSALDKIPNSKKIKVVCVGKTSGRDSELQIAAWKYHFNLTLTGGLVAKEVAKIINQSKFGISVSEKDANPRTLTETLACNVPLLVNSNLVGGQHLINKQTGIISKPKDLPKKIQYMLKNYKKFQPIKYFERNLQLGQIINRCFAKNLEL